MCIIGGAINASIPQGNFSYADLINMLPFQNYVMVVKLSGAYILPLIQNSVLEAETGSFVQTAGLRYAYNVDNTLSINERVSEVSYDFINLF